jgi:hypothetical protein
MYLSLQVKNMQYEPTGKYAYILENGAVVNNNNKFFPHKLYQYFILCIPEGYKKEHSHSA